MINGSKFQEDIANLNVYAPNKRASKYRRQKLENLKGEIYKYKEDLNTPHLIMIE